MTPLDLRIRAAAGPEPAFDAVMSDFLVNVRDELRQRLRPGSLLDAADLGTSLPWLWRLTFATRGLARGADGALRSVDSHVVVVRFPPDYLRRVNRFEVLHLLEPVDVFHPNLRPPHVCLEVYPGEPLVEVCEGLHALFSWRLRQLAETDALNPEACAWGRAHLADLPVDDRPLFGRALAITLEPAEVPT
jgi:hypothetical protein